MSDPYGDMGDARRIPTYTPASETAPRPAHKGTALDVGSIVDYLGERTGDGSQQRGENCGLPWLLELGDRQRRRAVPDRVLAQGFYPAAAWTAGVRSNRAEDMYGQARSSRSLRPTGLGGSFRSRPWASFPQRAKCDAVGRALLEQFNQPAVWANGNRSLRSLKTGYLLATESVWRAAPGFVMLPVCEW